MSLEPGFLSCGLHTFRQFFLNFAVALLCTAPLSLVKWRLINYYDDDDDDDDSRFVCVCVFDFISAWKILENML